MVRLRSNSDASLKESWYQGTQSAGCHPANWSRVVATINSIVVF